MLKQHSSFLICRLLLETGEPASFLLATECKIPRWSSFSITSFKPGFRCTSADSSKTPSHNGVVQIPNDTFDILELFHGHATLHLSRHRILDPSSAPTVLHQPFSATSDSIGIWGPDSCRTILSMNARPYPDQSDPPSPAAPSDN